MTVRILFQTFTAELLMVCFLLQVWTGLRFLAGDWLWMNKATLRYSDLPRCPQRGQQCGALAKKDTGSVEGTDCLLKLNFLCYSSA